MDIIWEHGIIHETMEGLHRRSSAERELRQIPGVGRSIASDLYGLGIRSVKELKDRNPEELYGSLCRKQGVKVDRCVLYVFRCAVYFASHNKHDPELLKWWNWQDKKAGQKPMAKLNKEWHLANRMPENPTHEQRMEWHIEHARHCRCHHVSPKLQKEIEEFRKR